MLEVEKELMRICFSVELSKSYRSCFLNKYQLLDENYKHFEAFHSC